jgi:signal transduction histidine kinase/ligand-binding sensor domain-containing protein
MHPRWWILLLITMPGAALSSRSAESQSATPSFLVSSWTTDDGLPQNTVNDIIQTPDGYLWLATFGGLVRFDGVAFTPVARDERSGGGSDRVLKLALDAGGGLWAATEDGVLHYAAGRLRSLGLPDGLPHNTVHDIFADRSGAVWVATQNGVARFAGAEGGVFRTAQGIEGVALQVVVDDAGVVWVRTGTGLLRMMPGARRFERDSTSAFAAAGPVAFLAADSLGGVWVRVEGAVARWHRGTLERFALPDAEYVDAATGPDGAVWLATSDAGIWHMPAGQRARPERTIRSRSVRAVFVDRDGTVWAGTNLDGLHRLRPRVFVMLPLADSTAPTATAILGDRAGRVWVGANCGPVNLLESGSLRTFRPASGTSPDCVWSLAEDRDGAIWMGTWGSGLYRYAGGRLRRYNGADGLNSDVVLALFVDRRGVLWAGTWDAGLFRLEEDRFVAVDSAALPDNRVRFITEDRSGSMWVATSRGLSRRSGGQWTTFTTADGLSHNSVRAIHEDADGVLWIGTYGGGLTRYANARFTAITVADGLYDNVVSAILEDHRGNLWMSSNHGVFRVGRAALDDFAEGRAGAVHSVAYGRLDGLLWSETTGGFQPAGWKAPDGTLWFPTIRGVAIVNPARAATHPVAPGVVIERVVVDGVPHAVGSEVRVGPGARYVEVWYTGLSSPAPERISFRYRLAGLRDEWTYAGSRRIAYFTAVRPRRYLFTVSAANRDGVWSETGASLALVFEPRYWETWWFSFALAITLLGAAAVTMRHRAVGAARARRARLEFERRLLEGQETERKRIAAELHDSIGQDLLVVKNRAQLALQAQGVAASVREQLQQISAIVSDTLRGVREIARNLRPAQLDRLGLSAAVGAMVEKAFESSGVLVRFEADGVDGLLDPQAEISVFRMAQEGVTNILRHSAATEAWVTLRRDGPLVELLIGDNGRGIQQPGSGRGFGIPGIGERARLLGGAFEIRSTPGEGTVLAIEVPVDAARTGPGGQ